MRVGFDVRPATDPRGIGRYVRSLLPALRAEAARHGGEISASAARDIDLLHSPWIDGAPIRQRRPTVVTLHDVVPLKRPGEYLRSGLRFRLRYLAVRRATRVIVPTHAVAADAIEHLGLDPGRLDVVGEAADAAFSPRPPEQVAAARAAHGIPEDYLLWVGGLRAPDPRKRVAALTAAPRALPLVLVGDAGGWARELDGVILTGAISDDALAALYTGARALLLPSDDEGFGLPPVEALACGTPVAASDVPAVREVLGDRATLVPADDLAGLVAAAERARKPAPAPLPRTWEDVARETWAAYGRAVATSR